MPVESPRTSNRVLVNNLLLSSTSLCLCATIDAGVVSINCACVLFLDNLILHSLTLADVTAVPMEREGLLFLPYLTGERLAVWMPLRAAFITPMLLHIRCGVYGAELEEFVF
ncbi:hypothetical protein L460_01725 [Klebsiella pneumoniae BIDMC 24]|nr:hypothetical protein L460_01725 [Klebsiella pneumoniae BIDMC 24]